MKIWSTDYLCHDKSRWPRKQVNKVCSWMFKNNLLWYNSCIFKT